jgi:hypothetical protein
VRSICRKIGVNFAQNGIVIFYQLLDNWISLWQGCCFEVGKTDFGKKQKTVILITLENSVFETFFIVNYVLKVLIVPNVLFITKTEF